MIRSRTTAPSPPDAPEQQYLDNLLRAFVRSALKSKFLSCQEISQYSGLSRSGLNQWLKGRRSMTLRSASRLVALLGYERFQGFIIRRNEAGDDVPRQPDLLELLHQINLVLRSLLEEKSRVGQAAGDGGEL